MTTTKKRGRPLKGASPLDNPITVRLEAGVKLALDDLADFYGMSKAGVVAKAVLDAWKSLTPTQRKALANIKKARGEGL